MMRKYETILIFTPTLSDQELQSEIERIKKIYEEKGAKNLIVDHWGKRELAYLMKKKGHGTYVVFYFESDDSEIIKQLTNLFRIMENVLRFQTHRIQEQVRGFKGWIREEHSAANA